MLVALLIGTILGFVLAIPPGPVAVVVMRYALEGQEGRGIKVGLGAAGMDIIYCLIILFATSALMLAFESVSSNYPLMVAIFKMLCVVGILGYGVLQMRKKQKVQHANQPISKKDGIIERIKSHGPFFIGVGIALANLANPTFLPSLTYSLMVVTYDTGLVAGTFACSVLFSLGFGIGTFAWVYLMLKVLLHYRGRMTSTFVDRLNRFAGITMIGFGTYLGYRVVALTKWSELLRFAF